MFNEYFRRELRLLRETSRQFANDNPALAGALLKASGDPDVERLMEGFAYLAAHLHQQMDMGSEKTIASLVSVLAPHLARPMPVATLLQFSPRSNVTQALGIKAGSHVESQSSENGQQTAGCRFRLCHDLQVLPITVGRVAVEQAPATATVFSSVDVSIELHAPVDIDSLTKVPLRFFVSGSPADAQQWLAWLVNDVEMVEIRGLDGKWCGSFGRERLSHAGLEARHHVFSSGRGTLPALEALRDYFSFPELFQFFAMDLSGLIPAGRQSVRLVFRAKTGRDHLPAIDPTMFRLNVCPAINTYHWEAEPLVVDQRQPALQLLPVQRVNGERPFVYSVDAVEGFVIGGTAPRRYEPLDANTLHCSDMLRFIIDERRDPSSETIEHWMTPLVPEDKVVDQREVLTLSLTCHDGDRAARLPVGQVSVNIGETPELLSFRNIIPTTRQRAQHEKRGHYWQLLGDLSAHRCHWEDAGQLRTFLSHQLLSDGNEDIQTAVCKKRIAAIERVTVSVDRRLYRDAFVAGRRIRLTLREDHFASRGDRWFFAMLLLQLFDSAAAFNTFTLLEVEDPLSGTLESLPPVFGGSRT